MAAQGYLTALNTVSYSGTRFKLLRATINYATFIVAGILEIF